MVIHGAKVDFYYWLNPVESPETGGLGRVEGVGALFFEGELQDS